MNKHLVILTFLLIAFQGMSQNREIRKLSDFTSVQVGEAVDLVLIKGDKHEAEINVDGVDLDEVITDVRGSRLYIERRSNRNSRGAVEINLTYQQLSRLSVNSAASVSATSVILTDQFDIDISSAGQAELELNVKELKVEISSAGSLEVSGTCESMDLEVSSAGRFEGFDLICSTVDAEVSSAGSGRVTAQKELVADAGTGGSIYYKGNPNKVIADSDLGGSVVRR